MTGLEHLERCRPWLEAALEYSDGAFLWQDVLDGIARGAMQFWPADRAAIVTQVLTSPQKKTLHVFLAGGELDAVLDIVPALEVFGRGHGCTSMSMDGRPGWERVLKDWKKTSIIMKKEL